MIGFVLWFLIICALLAILVIGVKWILGLAGITIPPPLLTILGIIVFIVLLIALWHFIGADAFGTQYAHRPL